MRGRSAASSESGKIMRPRGRLGRAAAAALALSLAVGLGGCVVAPARPYHAAHWVPGHYGRYGGWVPGHWT